MKAALWMVLYLALVNLNGADDPTEAIPGVQDLSKKEYKARNAKRHCVCCVAPETFDKVVNGKIHALVEFYAPWCGQWTLSMRGDEGCLKVWTLQEFDAGVQEIGRESDVGSEDEEACRACQGEGAT